MQADLLSSKSSGNHNPTQSRHIICEVRLFPISDPMVSLSQCCGSVSLATSISRCFERWLKLFARLGSQTLAMRDPKFPCRNSTNFFMTLESAMKVSLNPSCSTYRGSSQSGRRREPQSVLEARRVRGPDFMRSKAAIFDRASATSCI